MCINEDNRKVLPRNSKAQAITIVRALPKNYLFLLLSISFPLFLCFCLFFFYLLSTFLFYSSAVLFLFFVLFVFPCFLSPCDEEQKTVLASPFEIGYGFLLCVWLVFFWFFLLFSVQFPLLSPRPFSGFYNVRESLVSLPPETASIVEARDHGHRGYSGCDCWIFPIKPASFAQNIGDDEQCFQNGVVVPQA